MLGVVGETAIDCSAAAVTVNVVEPDIGPNVAVISDEPVATVLARPLLPAALLMVATPGVADIQVTMLVKGWVLLSVYTPVAVNCSGRPNATAGLPGLTWIETNTAGVTVSTVEPDMAPMALEMVAVPIAWVLATPCEPDALLTVATLPVSEAQVDMAVTSCTELSV